MKHWNLDVTSPKELILTIKFKKDPWELCKNYSWTYTVNLLPNDVKRKKKSNKRNIRIKEKECANTI